LQPINDKSKTPSQLDNHFYLEIRKSVEIGVRELVSRLDFFESQPLAGLEIAPQDHNILEPLHGFPCRVYSLDIDPDSGADYIGDICKFNEIVPDGKFDFIICTEVIEHVSNPQNAINELMRMTKVGGCLLFTSPFNFRVHGPLPDNWRISEWGWRTLLQGHEIVSLEAVESPGRELFPIHYRVIVKRV
jgi:SAM-dependent methyltransferase